MSTEKQYIGALDQGTTGTRFILFDKAGSPVASAYKEHAQSYPQPGWVEHDPMEIWRNACSVLEEALETAEASFQSLAAIGITNQRETTVLWQAATGNPIYPAIVWQDRRTSNRCQQLRREGRSDWIQEKTGLPIDPYFSATKAEWILNQRTELRADAERGDILFGTVDTWLIWNLTGKHVTDVTNASRTLLMNLSTLDWDEELLDLFRIPRAMLPSIQPSSGDFGAFRKESQAVPVTGNLGDQQAALFGQAGFRPGATKNTYGTGSFLLKNTGDRPIQSKNGLLTTVAYAIEEEPAQYALEGSVFITGAAVQWLRDELQIIASAAVTESMASSVEDTGGVFFVPAFAGLGAPYWNPNARGAILGLTRGTSRSHLARATLESIAFQSRDVVEAMAADTEREVDSAGPLRVDGGAVQNNFLCQFQSDILGIPVIRPTVGETTALGAAFAAGLAVEFWKDTAELETLWQEDRLFEPQMSEDEREHRYEDWKRAVRAVLSWTEDKQGQ